MNTVQEPITSQPLPAEHEHTSSDSEINPLDEVVTHPLPELNYGNPDSTEEERKKRRQQEDCCFYLEPEDGYDCFILCRCIFWICRSIGRCTESCCDCCAEVIHDCCDGEGGCCNGEGGCCDGDSGCCDGECDGNVETGGDGDCCDCFGD